MLEKYDDFYELDGYFDSDEFSEADAAGREIWTATLSGLCEVYYTKHPKDPVDGYLKGLKGNIYVFEIKNREKCPPERKAKYNEEGWMYEEWKDIHLKEKMNEIGAKEALFITITDDYIYIWETGHNKYKFFERDCTASTVKNYCHGEKKKSCVDLAIKDAKWKIKR